MTKKNNLDFARFLHDRGLLSAEAAASVRERSHNERLQIGQVLVMNGVMSLRQVMQVLEAQAEHPQVRFGELAVMLGHLTTVELEGALRQQREYRRHQMEIVLRDELVPRRELDAVTVKYVELLEMSAAESRPFAVLGDAPPEGLRAAAEVSGA